MAAKLGPKCILSELGSVNVFNELSRNVTGMLDVNCILISSDETYLLLQFSNLASS